MQSFSTKPSPQINSNSRITRWIRTAPNKRSRIAPDSTHAGLLCSFHVRYNKGVHLPMEPPILPMLAKRVDEIPAGEDWVFEPKWDGFRALVFRDGDEILIQSRDGKSLNRYFPELMEQLRRQLPNRCVLDGEIVIASADGLDFDALQLRIHPAASRVKLLSDRLRRRLCSLICFVKGEQNLMSEPFQHRRKALERLLSSAEAPLHLTPATTEREVASIGFAASRARVSTESWPSRFQAPTSRTSASCSRSNTSAIATAWSPVSMA